MTHEREPVVKHTLTFGAGADCIVVYRDEAGEYRWRRQAGNGEVLSQGESHPDLLAARDAALRANPDATRQATG